MEGQKNLKQSFYNNVYEIVKLIPHGRVTAYGAIAQYLGIKSGARMVGWAMNHSFNQVSIPAHRVVNRIGVLTGKSHFGVNNEMQKLLEAEGIVVIDDKIKNFEKVFWNPNIALL
ncbi:MAG: MGMT family protein [Cytophagales bacterium]|nr:MGMT family protein [Cytophagales bacterium]